MESFKIYDPRLMQEFKQHPNDALSWSSLDHNCLVVNFPPRHPAAIDFDLWVQFLSQFKPDMLTLHVDMIPRWGKTKRQIVSSLGSKSLRKKQYFAIFEHSCEVARKIIENYETVGDFQYWIIGGFSKENTSAVQEIEFSHLFEIEDFLREIKLFDFILTFDLDWNDCELICTREQWFDNIDYFVKGRYPQE